MMAVSGNCAQNVFLAQHCQRSRQLNPRFPSDSCSLSIHSTHPLQAWRLAWPNKSAMWSHTLAAHRTDLGNRASIYCNAAQFTSAISSSEKVDFLKLQNGSDIRGVAVAGVVGEPVSLTEPVAEAIAAAFADWLLVKKKPAESKRLRVSIGHDSRISAQKLQDAVSRGICSAGVDVIQYGLASTPAMFSSTLTENESILCPVDGSIMITASHLPYNRNGFKFFTNAGGLGKADIKDILERAAYIYEKFTDESLKKSEQATNAAVRKVDYMAVYTSDLVAAVRKAAGNIEKPLEGFHIIVDAGNGAGGFFAGKVLEPLGAVTTGSQFLEPDGMFPNHIPNPEDKAAMKAITQAVQENKADLGIIFDTDVDRSAAVDSTGREFNRNRLIALMSALVLEEHPGTSIVTDSATSDGLTAFIEKKLGGKHHRFKRGYKNVIDEAVRLNSIGEESHLAIETSGHGALKENHWLDDGAYLMVKLLNKLASARNSGSGSGSKVLTDLIEGLEEAAVAVELRLKIDQNHADLKGGSFRDYGEAVLKHLENTTSSDPKLKKAPINYEGVRVSGHGGWFLLRLSLHDPVLPLNIEAPSNEDAVKLGLAVLAAVKEFAALDTSALHKFVQQ
ncbi:phosphoglucomutase-like isoform X2 [Phoenix dactylifera]|uniref:phosphoglucomutase (alpha-D-glucose-1,6-bisphosphate-dependent) n=1 Tax=Phoenix dactylifera TaxID=42345 RepID=A0A8B7C4F8_PHODC|nr:phosphoglucomutase-like isoform X2 [Phoenix dactylifera]